MSYIPRVLAVLVGVRTDTLALGWSGSCPAYTYKYAHWWCPGVARSWGEPRTQHVWTHTQHTQHTYKYKGTHTKHTYTYKGTHKHTQTQLVVQQPVYDHQKAQAHRQPISAIWTGAGIGHNNITELHNAAHTTNAFGNRGC